MRRKNKKLSILAQTLVSPEFMHSMIKADIVMIVTLAFLFNWY
jgi:hypothetical protein